AHELAHTVQQTGGASRTPTSVSASPTLRPLVQRNGSPPAAGRNYWLEPDPHGGAPRVSVPHVRVAAFKESATRAELQRLYRRAGLTPRGPTDQQRLWNVGLSTDVAAALQAQGLPASGGPYLLRSRQSNLALGS